MKYFYLPLLSVFCVAALAAYGADKDHTAKEIGADEGHRAVQDIAQEFHTRFCTQLSAVKYKSLSSGGFPVKDDTQVDLAKCGPKCARLLADRLEDKRVTMTESNVFLESCNKACGEYALSHIWADIRKSATDVKCQKTLGQFYGFKLAKLRAEQYCEETNGKKAGRPEITKMAALACDVLILKSVSADAGENLSEAVIASLISNEFRTVCRGMFGQEFVNNFNRSCGNMLKKSRQDRLSDSDGNKVVKPPVPVDQTGREPNPAPLVPAK